MARSSFGLKVAAAIAAAIGAGLLLFKRDSAGGACTVDAYRKRVADYARAQIGKRELNKYFADAAPQFVGQKPEWCGIFALHCLHQAGLARDKQWKTGLGFLLTKPRPMPTTDNPQPGDIAYFENLQHQAVVLSVSGDTVELANGNGQGGVVALSHTPRSKPKAFYSIQPHIDDAIAKGCPT